MILIDNEGRFRYPEQRVMTNEKMKEFIVKNQEISVRKYFKLGNAYKNKYDIFRQKKKPAYKPDNRISVNYAKYITDTMNGFFIGIPIKSMSDDEAVQAEVDMINAYNVIEDKNAEISKMSSIYGRAYEMYYIDESSQLCIAPLSPIEAFIIYSEGIVAKPLYFVRYFKNSDNRTIGSYSDAHDIYYFDATSELKILETVPHNFGDVPAVEFIDNNERMGIFESAMPMIDEYNKAISEKANDVDYFADAYLKVIGARVDEEDTVNIRSSRIINFETNGENVSVDFMQKPNADTTQENLINRLQKDIFITSMVANISDEDFGASSGVALRYKLQAMSNLAEVKKRKFERSLNDRYRILFSTPLTPSLANGWASIRYKFTLNYPANLSEEVDIASKMTGITSKETQLSTISVIDNVHDEMDRIEAEEEAELGGGYELMRTADEQ